MAFWVFGPFTFKTRKGGRVTFFAAGFGLSLLPWVASEASQLWSSRQAAAPSPTAAVADIDEGRLANLPREELGDE